MLKSLKIDHVRTLSMAGQQGSPLTAKDRSHLLECMFQFSAIWQKKGTLKSELLLF